MKRYTDTVANRSTGEAVPNAQIRVLKADGSAATIYSDNGVTTANQPVLTDGLGSFFFYVSDGTYTLTVQSPGSALQTIPAVEIYEDATTSALANRAVLTAVGQTPPTVDVSSATDGQVLSFSGGNLVPVDAGSGIVSNALGSSTVVAPSQAAVSGGLTAKADASSVASLAGAVATKVDASGALAAAVVQSVSSASALAPSNSALTKTLPSNPKFYGYVGDGASHPLSSVNAALSLAGWQAIFPASSQTGSTGAQALTDEIDGLAAQRCIDVQVAALQAAVGVPIACVDLPAGFARFTRGLVTNGCYVSLRGAGRLATTVDVFGGNGWTHANGYTLSVNDITIRRRGTAGNEIGISGSFQNTGFAMSCKGLGLAGFVGGALAIQNLSGSRFTDCVFSAKRYDVYDTATFPLASVDGMTLTQTFGCFQNMFESCIFSGWNWCATYQITQPFEGQFFNRCHFIECNSSVRTINAQASYYALEYVFQNCEWENYAQWFSFQKTRDILLTGGFSLSIGGGAVASYIDLSDCQVIRIRDNDFNAFNFGTQFVNLTTAVDAQIVGNAFSFNNASSNAGLGGAIKVNAACVGIAESGNVPKDWPAGKPILFGTTAGVLSQYIAGYTGALQQPNGKYLFQSSGTGTLDSNGMLTVVLPTRPDGTALFTAMPEVVCSNGDALSGTQEWVSFYRSGSSATSIQIHFHTTTGNATGSRRANFSAIGAG